MAWDYTVGLGDYNESMDRRNIFQDVPYQTGVGGEPETINAQRLSGDRRESLWD